MKKRNTDRPGSAVATDAAAALANDIRPGQSLELLKELHILTREGKLNQDSRRKLKQVYHLYQFIEKLLLELAGKPGSGAGTITGAGNGTTAVADAGANADSGAGAAHPLPATHVKGITLADHGAGKSYLGFILYDLFFKSRANGHIYGIETRPELVQKSRELAQRLGFGRMSFLNLTVAESAQSEQLPARIDVVTALHACDTATDDAIAFGLQKRARYMVLVPCCQAEVARVLSQHKALSLQRTPLSELWRHPCTHAKWAARSPMCCDVCTLKPAATR